ncbi:uncharacterized protein LOC115753461 isoform X2 [Rhodamnia argentea]|uniref:Uncharacterized protein LOC115753461 isoform X2 n=1 Tax=Rhodamnia argentea TaxID=178133 RepID=A0A8B8QL80_9MYRT|nr:uncharacterized protein LOC115753461 isoform X2 [Rhodamnia argentea]
MRAIKTHVRFAYLSPSSTSPDPGSPFARQKIREEEEEGKMAISELGGAYLASCRQWLLPCLTSRRSKWVCPKRRRFLRCPAASHRETAGKEASTYTSRISTDVPLYESHGASFDQYLEDKPRVFQAIFPDKRRSQQLNEEEWRIQMLPIQFLLLTVWPVVDMRFRCKSRGRDYPPQIPQDISKVLELDITRWELQGLDSILKPSHFVLGVKGALYPDRRGTRSRLKGIDEAGREHEAQS